uniref:Uncharacterized protein n=1 Tax=Arundo donax TaxID=35708 RepID=A0A0A9HVP4_ARUDO
MQASTSMLEAKGEEILSWCDDDNFILEDDLAPDFEVPFLSMDLNALANQLSKLKLSQRLFIEEDLVPEDPADASKDNEIPIECDTSVETDAKGSSVQHNLIEPKKDVSHHEYASSIRSDDKMKTRHQPQCFEQKTTTSPKIGSQVGRSEEDESCTGIMDTEPSTCHRKGLKFEVDAAEEELDTLLNSFSGTHLSNSNLEESFGHDSTLQDTKISESKEKVTPITSSKSPALAPIDDALDDLLSETSISVQNESFAAPSLTSQQTSKSGRNIDFRYAKTIDVTSIDDSVDNLLEDTLSSLNEQKQTTSAQGQNNTSNDGVPPHSGLSNVTDDFDSWFDSL